MWNIDFPLPPLAEQERIVAKLDDLFERLDKIKASLDKIPVHLKNFRQQVLTQAVTGKLTEEWREGRDLGAWEEKKVDSLITKIQAGKNFRCPEIPVTKGQVGLVKISAVTWSIFDSKEKKQL